MIILVISLVLGIVMVEHYPTNTPVWGIFFTIGINFIFLIPITLIYSVTGFSFGLNVLVELIVGYAIPGNGTALNILKAYGYNIDGQAQNYITDQKWATTLRFLLVICFWTNDFYSVTGSCICWCSELANV